MGYDFQITDYYKLKHKSKEYPWPCKLDINRTIKIFHDDVLTKGDDGTFMIHTGLCCFGIIIPDEDVIYQDKPANLRLM